MNDYTDMFYKVYQLPLSTVLQTFPEIKQHWFRVQQLWKTRRTDSYFIRKFQENAKDKVAQELFAEASRLPDIEKYTALERDGLQKYYPETPYLEARFIDKSWILNRGKIAHHHLPKTENFQVQGVFWYLQGGYREWHSNYDYANDQSSNEFRMYLIDVDEDANGFFYYLDKNGDLQYIEDKSEVVNIFLFPAKKKFWHSVVSHTNRLSMGLRPHPDQFAKIAQMVQDHQGQL